MYKNITKVDKMINNLEFKLRKAYGIEFIF